MHLETEIPANEIKLSVLNQMADALRILAHGYRLKIVELLDLNGEMPVHEIVARLKVPQSVISNHLAKMKMARLIRSQRRGREVFYEIANDNVRVILNCIRKNVSERKGRR